MKSVRLLTLSLTLLVGLNGAKAVEPDPVPQQPVAVPPLVQGVLVDVARDPSAPTGSIVVAVAAPNVKYSYYEGQFFSVPKFSTLKPKITGQMYGLDLTLALQNDNFAMSFESYLKVDKAGLFRFFLTSDDGSRLFIDGKSVVNNDGLHAPATATGDVQLAIGMHKLQLGYFQYLGGADLRLQIEGPGVKKQDITPYLYLTSDGKAAPPRTITYTVNESTRFETVRGNSRQKVNFLREHRGERVDVTSTSTSATATPVATKVDIVLPLPPPALPPHVRDHKGPRPVFGTVVEVAKGPNNSNDSAITIRLREPPAPVMGVVVDVSADEDKDRGYLTVQTPDGKDVKFTVPASARIVKCKGYFDMQAGSFLSLVKGQTVVIYPLPHHLTATSRVDIMDGPVEALHRVRHHHRHHFATFLTTPDTVFVRTREGQVVKTNISSVQIDEEVGIWPTEKFSHVARKVDVFLPHIVRGVVTSVNSVGLSIKTANGDWLVPINAATQVEMVDNGVRKAATQSALAPGERVAVFPAGPAPHFAELVAIHLTHVTVSGKVVQVGPSGIVAQVRYPAAGTQPARDIQQTFQVAPTTRFEILRGTVAEPAALTSLVPGADVSIYANDLVPPVAEKVSILLPAVPIVPIVNTFVATGHLLSTAKNSLTLKIHHPATKSAPAYDTQQTYQVNSATKYEIHRGKTIEPATAAALQGDVKLTIHGRAGGNPPLADQVVITLPAKGAGGKQTVSGTIVAFANNILQVRTKDGNVQVFQVTANTRADVTAKGLGPQPINPAMLQPGQHVVVHLAAGNPNLADRIDVSLKKKGK